MHTVSHLEQRTPVHVQVSGRLMSLNFLHSNVHNVASFVGLNINSTQAT